MNLLAPAMLAGLAALALPVLAHLLGRERPKRIPFAAMRFLPEVAPIVSRRRTIRDIPLLVVRLAALALLVLVLARPATTRDDEVAVLAEPHDAVFVLDTSRSMNLRVDGQVLYDTAVQEVRRLLGSLPAGSTSALVASGPRVVRVSASEAPGPVLDALELLEADPIGRRTHADPLVTALPTALDALGPSIGDRRRVVYAVGDASRHGLGSLPTDAADGVAIIPVPVVPVDTELPAHASIQGVQWEPAPEIDPRAVRLRVLVARHGGDPDAPAQTLDVVLQIDDAEVARASAVVESGGVSTVTFTHTVAAASGAVAATVRLANADDDPLPDDDVRHLWLSVDRDLEILAINGDPSETRIHDEVYFVSTALTSSGSRVRLRSVAPDQLAHRIRESGGEALAEVDVLILANVAAPTDDVAQAITSAVRRGMGLWVTSGERVEASAYNERLGDVLPLLLREAVVLGTAPGRAEAEVEGLVPTSLAHPVLRGLSGDLGLSGARVRRAMLMEPDADRDTATALSFTHGAPALITSDRTGGRVAFLATTVDRDWTDMALHPGFVPLVQQTIAYLAAGGRRSGADSSAELITGRPFEISIPDDRPLAARTPDARQLPLVVGDDGAARLTDTFVPGHYRIHGAGDPTTEVAVFCAVVDPAESETDPVELKAGQPDGEHATVTATRPAWRSLVLIIAGLLVLETLLRHRRRD